MAERCLLDTSAFVAFLQAEPGASRVPGLLEKAARHEVEVFACFVSLTEVQYITFYENESRFQRSGSLSLARRREWFCAGTSDAFGVSDGPAALAPWHSRTLPSSTLPAQKKHKRIAFLNAVQ
jgi:predicted nucleic acid-binding protein